MDFAQLFKQTQVLLFKLFNPLGQSLVEVGALSHSGLQTTNVIFFLLAAGHGGFLPKYKQNQRPCNSFEFEI